MSVTEFSDLMKTINLIDDLVISDITYEDKDQEDMMVFKKNLYAMKAWFTPISSSHKKRFICDLLLKMQSAYAVSIVLKCIWSCYLKDAVMSGSEIKPWIGYDQTPLDHDRAIQLSSESTRLEDKGRRWFFSLCPEMQAFVLCELLIISGGPIVCAALRVARDIYNEYRQREIEYIRENLASFEVNVETTTNTQNKAGAPSFPSAKRTSVAAEKQNNQSENSKLEQALKEKDVHEKAWNKLISEMRAKLNVEEINLTFADGTDRTIWKLNKTDNACKETVDFVQLLPASVGKRILPYIPDYELDNFARVNKYWSYLVEGYRAESATRSTIRGEMKRLEESIFPETIQTLLSRSKLSSSHDYEEQSSSASSQTRDLVKIPSIRVLTRKMPTRKTYTSVRSLKQLTERIQIRGAADEVIFRRLDTNHRLYSDIKKVTKEDNDVSYLRKHSVSATENIRKISEEKEGAAHDLPYKERGDSSLHLWTTDFSSLYPVLKIASYELEI